MFAGRTTRARRRRRSRRRRPARRSRGTCRGRAGARCARGRSAAGRVLACRDAVGADDGRARAPRAGAAPRARAPRTWPGSLSQRCSVRGMWATGPARTPACPSRSSGRSPRARWGRGAPCRPSGPDRARGRRRALVLACVPTDGTLVELGRLDRILDADPASGLVKAEAGITLAALNRGLQERGLAMPNLGDIDAQTLAGALATATHGTGARLPNLSAQVAALDSSPAGERRTLTDDDGDLLRAARVGLGSLGIVTAVTLRCVPAFRLRGVDATCRWRRCSARSTSARTRTTTSSSGRSRTRRWPSRAPTTARTPRWGAAGCRSLAARRAARQPRVGAAQPRRARASRVRSRASTASPRAAASGRERVDWSHRVFASPRLVRFDEMEYAIPRGRRRSGPRRARDPRAPPVNFPVELRFIAARRRPALARARARQAYSRSTCSGA